MFQFFNFMVFAGGERFVESPPGRIMGPIANLFGIIINFFFNIVYNFTTVNSLGLAIILLTLVFRALMTPLHIKSQKSVMKMRELAPELKKIKEKYGDTKDPELLRKMNAEQQALYAKNGANPFSGCLPMLIQMPLFIGLNIVIRQASQYITELRRLYEELAVKLLEIPGMVHMYYEQGYGVLERVAYGMVGDAGRIIRQPWQENLNILGESLYVNVIRGGNAVTETHIQQGIEELGGDVIIMGWYDHLARVISRFNPADWDYVYDYISAAAYERLPEIQYAVTTLSNIETFLTISIVDSSGWGLPGVIIPLLTAITMFISSWLMQQRTYDPNANDQQKMMGKMTLYVMPLFIGFITVGLVAAVGLFFLVGQIFQIIHDLIWLKRTGTKIRLPFKKYEEPAVEVLPASFKKRKK